MPDPFDVLQIEPNYALNLAVVGKRHRELSSALHPDRYAGKTSAERRAALSRAIEVNEAFRTVKDPIARAEAILQRHGIDVSEEARRAAPPELLMDMMELRERLAELKATGDVAGVEELGAAVRERESAAEARVADALERLREAGADVAVNRSRERIADAALRALGELRYTRRFFDELGAILDELA